MWRPCPAMTDATPRFEHAPAPQGQAIRLLGEWTAAQFADPRLFRDLRRTLPRDTARQGWDLREAAQLDHVGAQMLWDHWGQRWPQHLETLPSQRTILERVAEFTRRPESAPKRGLQEWFLDFGGSVLNALGHGRYFIRLIGQLTLDLRELVRAPHRAPWRDFSGHLYHIGATALPITALVGGLIGVVLAYLTAQ